MRFFPILAVVLGLAASGLGIQPLGAQEFYGTGSSYTGAPVPMGTLNAIGAGQRRQSAAEGQLRLQQQLLRTDQKRITTTGPNLGCFGKAASVTGCADKPVPQIDRRSNSLKQRERDLDAEEEQRLRGLQP